MTEGIDTPIIYKMPRGRWIGSSEHTKRLYQLEKKRDDAFDAAAREWQSVISLAEGREVTFWGEAVPEAFLSMMEGWDRTAVTNAAIAFLQKHGFTVNEPDEE